MHTDIRQPPPDMNVEETFDGFVEYFGGELISKLHAGDSNAPKNADYFFRNRTVIAELKCLEKDYSTDDNIGKKVEALFSKWARQGQLRPEHFKGNTVQVNDLGYDCALELFKLFFGSMRTAVKTANRQIRETKKYYSLPNSKGLLIIANDGNYSLTPDISMMILARLLQPNLYSSIDSFIYFTPNMRVASHRYDRQANLWISGPKPLSVNAIEEEYLDEIQRGWENYLAHISGEKVMIFREDDPDSICDLRFVR